MPKQKRERRGKPQTTFYIYTDGVSVFHAVTLKQNLSCGSNQEYELSANTEDTVFAKCFVTPARDADGEYDIDTLTPKSEAAIIAAAEGE